MAESSTPTFTRTSPATTELLWTKPCCSMEAEAVAQATLHLMAPPAVAGSATCLCELTFLVFLINMSYSAICKTWYLLSGIPYPLKWPVPSRPAPVATAVSLLLAHAQGLGPRAQAWQNWNLSQTCL